MWTGPHFKTEVFRVLKLDVVGTHCDQNVIFELDGVYQAVKRFCSQDLSVKLRE